MNRVLEIKMFPTMGAVKRPLPCEILDRIRAHFVGRVVTLAAATAFNAILSVALLPLATRHLGASDYGIYGLVISIVILVSAAADGGAGLLVPAHYGSASESERARLFVSVAIFAGIAASIAGLLIIIPWLCHHGPFSDQGVPRAAIVLSVALMPMRAITNISVMIFSVTDRGLAIAAQLAIQSFVTFLSTLVALFEFKMGGTSLFVGAFCGQFAALGVGLVALGRRHVSSLPSRDWFRRAATNSPTTAASGIVDGTRGFGENALLTSAISLHAVGILGHARLYHGLLMALSNAVGHNLWAKSLEEARNPHSSFDITRSAWTHSQGGKLSTLSAMASSPRPRLTFQHSSSSRSFRPLSNRQTPWYAHWGGQRRQLGLVLLWRLEVLSPSIPRSYCLASRASLLFASLKRLYIASTCAC